MVLNNVTKFHKIMTKKIELESGRRSGRTYGKCVRTDRDNT